MLCVALEQLEWVRLGYFISQCECCPYETIALPNRVSSPNCIACVFNSRTACDKCYSNLMLGDEIEVLNVVEDHAIPLQILSHAKLKLYPLSMQ